MRKLTALSLAGATALAIAGAAIAADRQSKTMNVPMADGSTVTIEYVGDVAPKVTVVQADRPWARPSHWSFPDLADFDRLFADMRRRQAEMMRLMETLSRPPLAGGPGINLASTGNAPAGSTSVSVVSVSNGGKTCTRTTEVVSQGVGKPPKVTTNVSGECAQQVSSGAKTPAVGPTT